MNDTILSNIKQRLKNDLLLRVLLMSSIKRDHNCFECIISAIVVKK